MTDFLQLLVFFIAAVNPAAAAGAPAPRGATLPPRTIAVGLGVALILVGGAALLSGPILDGLGVEPETFRVGAGVVFLVGGALAALQGSAPHRGPWEGPLAGVFPLGLPVLATPAAIAAAVTYGADRGELETLAAAGIVLVAGALLVTVRAGRFESITDALARISGALLVVVAAGLIVSGVRAI